MDGPHTRDLDESLQLHQAAHGPASDCPLLEGAKVTLLASGAEALDAIFAAIESARRFLHMQFYIFEDVRWRGRSLIDLLVRKLEQGVQVALSYDGAGSQETDDALFEGLRCAGAALLEFRPFNPFRPHFSLLKLNDRDHRKMLVADGRVAILGGVNLDQVYANPRSAGTPPDSDDAFWYDAAASIEGPPVAELERLFLHN